MNNSHEPETTFGNIFNTWEERVIRIETNLGMDINISDLNPLKINLYQFIEQNLQTHDDTSLIEEEIFDIYTDFMITIPHKCSGETFYGWILSDLIIRNIFNRDNFHTFEQLIEMRKQNIIEEYLNQYNPVSNFGDLF